MIVLWTLFLFGSFFLGSVLFSRLIAKQFGKKDIVFLASDGNPGAANVFLQCGKKLGSVALILDILKGAVPVCLATFFLPIDHALFALVMVAPVLGHAVGIFDGFRGGKCIATSFGVLIGLMPVSRIGFLLAALYILFSTVLKINPHSRRSILTYALFAVGAILLLAHTPSLAVGCFLISTVAIVKHALPAPHTEQECTYDQYEQPRNHSPRA